MFRLVLAACACLLLATPVAADAAVRVGPPTGSAPDVPNECRNGGTSCTAIGVAHPAAPLAVPSDGVVVRWRTHVATGGATILATLHFVRLRSDGAYAGVAEDARTLQQGENTFDVRIPVTRGTRLAITTPESHLPLRTRTGARFLAADPALDRSFRVVPGPPADDVEVLVNADVEPDADRDGYGDETQDECPSDPARQTTCSGTRVGPDLTGPDWLGLDSCAVTCIQTTVGGGAFDLTVPADGVLVAWRTRLNGGTLGLHVLQPDGAGGYTVAAADAEHAPPAGELTGPTYALPTAIETFRTRVPVRAGQVLAMFARPTTRVGFQMVPGTTAHAWLGARAEGVLGTPQFAVPELAFAINADLEPDADGDGHGDLTQDACPADAGRQGACAAPPGGGPVPAPPAPAAGPAPRGTPSPAPAARVAVARLAASRLRWNGRSALTPRLACPRSAPETCRGTLVLRRGTRQVGRATFAVRRGATRAVRVKVRTPLPRRGPLRLTAAVTPRGGGKTTRTTLTVTRARR